MLFLSEPPCVREGDASGLWVGRTLPLFGGLFQTLCPLCAHCAKPATNAEARAFIDAIVQDAT